jgi:hypothetical protein
MGQPPGEQDKEAVMTRRTVLGVACLAILAMSLLGAAGASAVKNKLDLTWNGEAEQLKPGETFQAVLAHYSEASGEGTPTTFTVETNPGTITCTGTVFPWSGIGGIDETNNELVDKLKANETAEGVLFGSVSCPNTTGLGAEARVYLYPEKGKLELNGYKGIGTLKQKSTTEPMFLVDVYSGGAVCEYKLAKLGGAVGSLKLEPRGLGTSWNQLVWSFSKQTVTFLKSASSPECPKKASVSATFGYASKGEGGFGEGFFVFGHLD